MMYGYTVNSELILEAWARYRPDYSINPYQKNTSKLAMAFIDNQWLLQLS